MSVSITALPPMDRLEDMWRALESRADGSFFTSWSWVGAWLATGVEHPCLLLSASAGGQAIGLGILTQTRRRWGVWPRRVAALNRQSGGADDSLYIEYNDLLVDRACAARARRDMIRAVLSGGAPGWDDLEIAGATPEAAAAAADLPAERRPRECPWVDLTVCGSTPDEYLAVLSRNTRAQVRRALRLAGGDAELSLQRARAPEERAGALEELRALHQAYWTSKGRPGAFASPRFTAFIAALLPRPGVELLRITARDRTIGVLLNFVHRGHVYAYQSGFAYGTDNRFKPGLVSHVLAIADAARLGRTAYHFMAGEARYKESLATGVETLNWLTLRRPGPATAAMTAARGAGDHARDWARNFGKHFIRSFASGKR